jgi:hypothetical protein
MLKIRGHHFFAGKRQACTVGRYEFDAAALKFFDVIANGAGVLLNDGRNFRREFSTGMKPKNFKPSHDALIGKTIPQPVKKLSIFVGIIRA